MRKNRRASLGARAENHEPDEMASVVRGRRVAHRGGRFDRPFDSRYTDGSLRTGPDAAGVETFFTGKAVGAFSPTGQPSIRSTRP